jgi:hypothetical protein
MGPDIQVRRTPFLSNIVVMVAVETARSVAMTSELKLMRLSLALEKTRQRDEADWSGV